MFRANRFELASRASSFFAAGDHQNLRSTLLMEPLTRDDLRYLLNYQLLFSENISFIAEDMLVNEALMSLLAGQYREALSEGLFVPLLRTGYMSIGDCADYLSAPDFYNQTGDEVWRWGIEQMRRAKMTTGNFDPDEAYAHFTEVALKYFSDDGLLRQLGLRVPGSLVNQGVTEIVRESGRSSWRRSAFFSFADKLAAAGNASDAVALRRISSVMYMAHFGGLFQQVSIFPAWYEPYVTTLASIESVRAPIDQSRTGTLAVPLLEAVLPNTRRDDLGRLEIEDILRLRDTDEFRNYIRALKSGDPSADGVDRVISLIARYLESIDEFFANRSRPGRSKLGSSNLALALVRRSSEAGTVVGFADVVASGPLGTTVGAVLAGSGLILLALDKGITRLVDTSGSRNRDIWNAYCGSDGTFSAQVGKLRGGITR